MKYPITINTAVRATVIHEPPTDLVGTTGWRLNETPVVTSEDGVTAQVVFQYTTEYFGTLEDITLREYLPTDNESSS